MKLAKFFVIALNICFLVLSIAMISSASSLRFILGDFYDVLTADNSIAGLNIIWIAGGFVLLVVGIFGLCSALKDNSFMTNLFTVILSFTLILNIVTATTSNNLSGELKHVVSDSLKHLIHQYGKNPELTSIMDSVQKEYNCCGYDGPSDWQKPRSIDELERSVSTFLEDDYMIMDSKAPVDHLSVPKSCCKKKCNDYYSRGCFKLLYNDIAKVILMVKTLAMLSTILQIFGVLAAYIFGRTLRD